MINSENKSGASISGTDMTTFLKQSSATTKKPVLRDVQNHDKSLIHNHQDIAFVRGKPISDETKVSGAKRATPECPLRSPNQRSLNSQCTNEHLLNVRRRFELELGNGRFQKKAGKHGDCPQARNFCLVSPDISQKQGQIRESTIYQAPVSTENFVSPTKVFENGGQSVSNFLGQPGNAFQAAKSESLEITPDFPSLNNSKGADDQQWKERFIHLQNFLKQSDETNQSNSIQMLIHFSSAELSRHAVELEKRAIQLAIEEGKEIQRMKALNILGKSVPTSSSAETTHPQSKK